MSIKLQQASMSKIVRVHAREILDSRGKPTVEAEVHLDDGTVGRASVPIGASTGAAEACELRDADSPWYNGLGVRRAVQNVVQVIGPAIAGLDPADQPAIDERMIGLDGTPTKSRLGANAILAVSLAAARAAALARGRPLYRHLGDLAATAPKLPLPMTNMISGALHAGGNLDVQDVLVIPSGAPDYPTQLEWTVRVYWRLGRLLRDGGFEGYLVGDEGGFAPRLGSNSAAIEFVVRAIEAAELRPGDDVAIALDVAATHLYQDGEYHFLTERGQRFTTREFYAHLEAWINRFPIASIEDGLAESDWEGWRELTARLGDRVMLIGDDLFATNEKLLQRGISEGVANAVLIKVNQIGTLTETLRTMRLAREHGYKCIVSARSGETEDDFLADLAVGTAADYIKIGGVARSERLAKYNRLLRIAEELG
jgi:enolase